jgi:hypothetical protein
MRVARRMPEGRFEAALRPGWMPHPPFLPAAALGPALPCAAATDVRWRSTVIQGTAPHYAIAWSERKPPNPALILASGIQERLKFTTKTRRT